MVFCTWMLRAQTYLHIEHAVTHTRYMHANISWQLRVAGFRSMRPAHPVRDYRVLVYTRKHNSLSRKLNETNFPAFLPFTNQPRRAPFARVGASVSRGPWRGRPGSLQYLPLALASVASWPTQEAAFRPESPRSCIAFATSVSRYTIRLHTLQFGEA